MSRFHVGFEIELPLVNQTPKVLFKIFFSADPIQKWFSSLLMKEKLATQINVVVGDFNFMTELK
jgi:hypothetical protein